MPSSSPSPQSLTLKSGRKIPLHMKRTAGKRLRLRVSPEGVVLSVPSRTAKGPALAFLNQSLGWIETQVAALPEVGQPPYAANDDWEVPLVGHIVPVVWHPGSVSRVDVVGDDDALHAWTSPKATDASRRALISSALDARLRKDVAGHLSRWLPTIPGGLVSKVVITPTQSQWGSMNRAGRLSLASSLVGARPSALEYVVVHELCHQIHMDHSPQFWSEVRRRCPGYKEETAYLNRVGLRLHGLMARLR